MFALVALFSLLTISLAGDVFVYDYYNYVAGPESLIAKTRFPWRFQYDQKNHIKIYVTIKKKSANVTLHNVRYSTAHGATKAEKMTIRGTEYYYVHGYFNSTKITIKIDLYKANVLCSCVPLAEGRSNWPANRPFLNISDYRAGIVLEVDLSNKCRENTTTVKTEVGNYNFTIFVPKRDDVITETTVTKVTINGIKNSRTMKTDLETVTHKYLPDYVPTSLHDIVITETTTNKVTRNGTNTTTTDNRNVIIISLTIGVLLVLLLIFAVWKCYAKHLDKPLIPIIAPSEPFYLNMLFRRECDQEIEEIDQHQYEDIEEHHNERADNYYEEINRH